LNSAIEALERLKQGNQRFVSEQLDSADSRNLRRRQQLVSGQKPFAAVLGCIDSRAPVEVLFDQGIGDMMVCRVAGNYACPSVLASLEFAACQVEVPLIVVMGHTQCGAVNATFQLLQSSESEAPGYLQHIIEGVAPALRPYLKQADSMERQELLAKATADHVRATVARLTEMSEPLAARHKSGELLIVGAIYHLASGVVDFLEP
jgi:carbonic anhydrase